MVGKRERNGEERGKDDDISSVTVPGKTFDYPFQVLEGREGRERKKGRETRTEEEKEERGREDEEEEKATETNSGV